VCVVVWVGLEACDWLAGRFKMAAAAAAAGWFQFFVICATTPANRAG